MFKASLSDPSLLRDSLDTVSHLINEGTFSVSNNGVELTAMDPASVAMVMFKFLASAFDEFSVKKPLKITFNISYLVSVLKRAGAGDRLVLEIGEKDNNKLKVIMKGDVRRTFTVPLIDTPEGEQKIPDLSFPVSVSVDAGVFKGAVRDALMIDDCIVLEADGDSFNLVGSGDNSDVNIELTKDSPSLHEIQAPPKGKGVRAKFSLEYLDKMISASKVADRLKVQFGQDYPLKLEYKSVDKVLMSFILAPRVDTD